jgi:hypothetical protein
MSDRPLTVSSLSAFVETARDCTALTVSHSKKQRSFRDEHGPHSGDGYFRDLALATSSSQAAPPHYVGFIGSKDRSSSLLLLELMEYDRRIQAHAKGNSSIGHLPICWLPKVAKG